MEMKLYRIANSNIPKINILSEIANILIIDILSKIANILNIDISSKIATLVSKRKLIEICLKFQQCAKETFCLKVLHRQKVNSA